MVRATSLRSLDYDSDSQIEHCKRYLSENIPSSMRVGTKLCVPFRHNFPLHPDHAVHWVSKGQPVSYWVCPRIILMVHVFMESSTTCKLISRVGSLVLRNSWDPRRRDRCSRVQIMYEYMHTYTYITYMHICMYLCIQSHVYVLLKCNENRSNPLNFFLWNKRFGMHETKALT